jgi:hypothetical protein
VILRSENNAVTAAVGKRERERDQEENARKERGRGAGRRKLSLALLCIKDPASIPIVNSCKWQEIGGAQEI